MGAISMKEYITDKKGKWIKEGVFKSLVESSKEYIQQLEQERLDSLLEPVFKEPDVSDSEIQIAKFILDITERIKKLEGGSV